MKGILCIVVVQAASSDIAVKRVRILCEQFIEGAAGYAIITAVKARDQFPVGGREFSIWIRHMGELSGVFVPINASNQLYFAMCYCDSKRKKAASSGTAN